MSVKEKMTAIADNIRSRTGKTEPLTLDDMANGINEVYDAGQKAEYDDFWDNVRMDYQYAFMGTAWNEKSFIPDRDVPVTVGTFERHNWQGTAYDLASHLERLGVKLIFNTGCDTTAFRYAWFTRLPVMDFSSQSGTLDREFYGMSRLVTIDKIILPAEGQITSFSTPFYECTRLANITFEGVIDKSISFSYSPLTVSSLKSIITALKDFSGTDSEYSYTITFKASAFSALEAEGTTAEYNSVACTWAELIDNKKWNLVKA